MSNDLQPQRRRVGAGVFTLLLAASVALIAIRTNRSGQDDQHHWASPVDRVESMVRGPVSPAVIRRVEPVQTRNFELLRTPPEGLPKRLRKTLRQPLFGMNSQLAQRLPAWTGVQAWIVPARGALCIVTRQRRDIVGLSCPPTRYALHHGVFTTFLYKSGDDATPTRRVVIGVVSDIVREVAIATNNSTTGTPVLHGVFVVKDTAVSAPGALKLVDR